MAATNWDKFRLLMWKNWLLQYRHKTQTIVQLLVPVLFSALLVLIRGLVDPVVHAEPFHFPQLNISLDSLRGGVEPSGLGLHYRLLVKAPIGNTTFQPNLNWRIVYTPNVPILDELLRGASNVLQLQTAVGVNSSKELSKTLVQQNLFVGLEFHNPELLSSPATLPKQLEYSIRFPSELRTSVYDNPILYNWRTNLLFPRFQILGPRNPNDTDDGIPSGYIREGFLAVQNAIASQFLFLKSNGTNKMPEIMMQRYPYPEYIEDILLTGLETLVSLIIMISLVYSCTTTVKFIAIEKEKQLKEAMKIMGLANWLHWLSWFVRSMILLGTSISFIVMLFKVPWYKDSDVAIFTYSNWTCLWVFLFTYSIATTTFCFMLSVFFSKANTASAVSGLIWFLSYSVYSFTYASYDQLLLYQKLLMSLFSNTAMAFGFQLIIRLEGSSEGLQWNNFFRSVSVDDNLSLGLLVVTLLIAALLYLMIALYVEKIFPGEYGVPLPWYFPFTRVFWCGQSEYVRINDSPKMHGNLNFIEDDPIGRNSGIRISNLRKVYSNNRVAVNGLTLNMFDDDITVLLGHNGAGKTTTMSLLSGMFPPSSGTALINGKDIRHDISGVRSSLGLCPQHNILFDELTVREHIVFFSRLKGLNKDAVEREVEKYLKLIDLEPKRNAKSKTLSGGMKRKLAVCVAFCGGSKVVLLDEPTSGMDPQARRALWDVLKAQKKGRTVLLSTHFMDEADILGDRIAIMANGNLKCVGSSFFLKKQFGCGYHLVCVKKPNCDTEKITSLLKLYMPDVKVECDVGTELSYQLSDKCSHMFSKIFSELEIRSNELGVDSYGVSLTTLEEVFMKVGTDTIKLDDEPPQMNGTLANKPDSEFGSETTLNYATDISLLSGVPLIINQVRALFMKKILQTARNWLLMLIQICIPVLFITITVLSERSRAWYYELPPLKVCIQRYLESVTVLEVDPNANQDSLIAKYSAEYQNQMQTDQIHEFEKISENFEAYILRLARSMLVRVNSRYLAGATIRDPLRIVAHFNNQPYHTAPLSLSLVHNAVLRSHLGVDHSITVFNKPLNYSSHSRMKLLQLGGTMGFQLAVNVGFAMAFVASFYVLSYIKERTVKSKLLQFVSGANVLTFWVTAFLWDIFTFIVTILFLVITFAGFQEEGWSTALELSRIFFILLIFVVAILPVTMFASRFFKDPADGYSVLSMIYIFTGMACFFIVFIMSLEQYDLQDTARLLTWIFMIFPHFALSHGLGNINMITSFNQICDMQCKVIPGCTKEIMCEILPLFNSSAPCCDNDYFKWNNFGIGRNLLFMSCTGIAFFIILLVTEYSLVSSSIYSIKRFFTSTLSRDVSDEPIDFDVVEEKNRVTSMSETNIRNHNLVLMNVTKLYGKFVAVHDMSIAVEHSECFGLLGVNGAGKTTTFKMLTGDVKISNGEAWVRGLSLKNDMNKVHQIIGYCPQFDALIGEMTGRETLTMYCLLRGIPNRRIRSIVLNLAADFNFIKHIDKRVKMYSGGNKRKLSTAIALVGNPAIVYLDEPTTGMDPGARRQLWDMICKVRKSGKSIMLTSHSMDECEALCTRLAIMVNGEFKCLGSVQHLKNKFSKGYTLSIKVKKNNFSRPPTSESDGLTNRSIAEPIDIAVTIEELKEFVESNFPGANLQEEYSGLLTYFIPNSNAKWSAMFGLMEEAKLKFNIEDYSLSQTTLEQVFLSFAKLQHEEKREHRN
ncbi:ATP-binding cassette sub-family A member 3-like isoform X1 [Bradysia coprophila]|uniref:ATP-binding cassette sub-family A member 3-like isoform X1 n=1 Tax=Bradysia coprophila TaxID=38358 RepID=UPI00187D8FA7|nr:ATP-binding cassette sub-family A member 3-like isoform X1 [Bradysia coprophila]